MSKTSLDIIALLLKKVKKNDEISHQYFHTYYIQLFNALLLAIMTNFEYLKLVLINKNIRLQGQITDSMQIWNSYSHALI